MHGRGGAEHERAKAGVANRTWPIQDGEREKVRVGPGLRECEAGYETNNCGKLRVRWSWNWGVSKRTWPIQDEKRAKK